MFSSPADSKGGAFLLTLNILFKIAPAVSGVQLKCVRYIYILNDFIVIII